MAKAILESGKKQLVLDELEGVEMPSALASTMVGAAALTAAMAAGLLSVSRLWAVWTL